MVLQKSEIRIRKWWISDHKEKNKKAPLLNKRDYYFYSALEQKDVINPATGRINNNKKTKMK